MCLPSLPNGLSPSPDVNDDGMSMHRARSDDDDDLDHTRAVAATAALSLQIGFILMHCREPPEEDYPKLDLSADERRRSRGRGGSDRGGDVVQKPSRTHP